MRYSGDLAKRIKPGNFASEWPRKLGLLFDHYGISQDHPEAVEMLLYALIIAHVPGLNAEPVRGSGQPAKWTPDKRLRLIRDVEALNKENGVQNDEAACKRLVKEGRWKGTPASLAKRLREARGDPGIQAFQELKAQRILSLAEIVRLETLQEQVEPSAQ